MKLLLFLKISFAFVFAFAERENAKILRREAETYIVSKQYDKAERALTKVIRLEPDVSSNYFKRARVYQRRGKHESAVRDFTKSIALKPNQDSANAALGKLLRKLGRCEDAEMYLRRAVELNAKRHGAKLDPEIQAAKKCSQRLRDVRRVLGDGFETRVSFEGIPENALRHAVAYMEEVINTTPFGYKHLIVLARVHVALNELYEALALTGRALKIRRDDIDALLLRTKTYYRLAEHDTALNHVRECLKTDPDNVKCKDVYKRI